MYSVIVTYENPDQVHTLGKYQTVKIARAIMIEECQWENTVYAKVVDDEQNIIDLMNGFFQ